MASTGAVERVGKGVDFATVQAWPQVVESSGRAIKSRAFAVGGGITAGSDFNIGKFTAVEADFPVSTRYVTAA
jgi:hypothetical protein